MKNVKWSYKVKMVNITHNVGIDFWITSSSTEWREKSVSDILQKILRSSKITSKLHITTKTCQSSEQKISAIRKELKITQKVIKLLVSEENKQCDNTVFPKNGDRDRKNQHSFICVLLIIDKRNCENVNSLPAPQKYMHGVTVRKWITQPVLITTSM